MIVKITKFLLILWEVEKQPQYQAQDGIVAESTVSPLPMDEFCSESVFLSPICS